MAVTDKDIAAKKLDVMQKQLDNMKAQKIAKMTRLALEDATSELQELTLQKSIEAATPAE